MSTRLQLQTETALRLRDTALVVFTAPYLNNALNAGYEYIMGHSPFWPFLETMANSASQVVPANGNVITLPTDVWRIISVNNDTDKYALAEITGHKQFLALYPDPTAQPGTPKHYRLFNNQLQVFPYAASATQLRVEYYVTANLANDADIPAFPSEWHNLLVEYAMFVAYTDDGNLQQAQAHFGTFQARLADMKASLLGPRGDSYPQINDDLF